MNSNITAEIVAIGTEILLGEITDTNSVHIARTFRDYGINIFYMTSVGDNEGRIADAIRVAMDRADIVLSCGGLGPTVDDVTRQAVARATDRELQFEQELYDQIAARFNAGRMQMTENNRRQAFLPAGSIPIVNPVGTAPSFIVEHNDKIVISLPGVPREMKYLLHQAVLPYLQQRFELGIIKARILRTAGVGESMLDDMIGTDLLEQSNPTIGLAAHQGMVDVRITAKADDEDTADLMLQETEHELRQRIGKYVFGEDNASLEEVFVNFLSQHDLQLAVIEAGISDAVTAKITTVEGGDKVIADSRYYDHPDELLDATVRVDETQYREKVLDIARQYSIDTSADAVIAIVSDPDINENSDAEHGTVVVVYTPHGVSSRIYGFGAQSELARDWVSRWGMARLWRMLNDQYVEDV